METEIWKWIPEFEGLYQVSNQGRLKSFKCNKEKILKGTITKKGYVRFTLKKNDKQKVVNAHRLICELFNGESPEGKEFVNHIDGNKANNHYANLEWVSLSENQIHAVETGLLKYKTNKKRPVIQKTLDGEIIEIHPSIREAARNIGAPDPSSIRTVCKKYHKTAYGYIWEYAD